MNLEVLPVRADSAAGNMAADFLMLQRHPHPANARFRHYGWRSPAFTFGYSQKIDYVRTCLPPDTIVDLCRRQTGGGVVDHRQDWTYSLVIPRGHPFEEKGALHSYRAVHEAIAGALGLQGFATVLQPVASDDAGAPAADLGKPARGANGSSAAPGVCFSRAEIFDLIHPASRAKIAGAAQKRNKNGLLFQGSLWKPAVGRILDWERFHEDLPAQLATALGASATPAPWPDFNEDELAALTEQYSSPDWTESR